MLNLVEVIEAQVTPEQVERISTSTGESPIKTRQAMSAGVLAIIGGIIQRASSAGGAANLLALLRSPPSATSPGGEMSVALSSGLVGERADHLTDAVAKTSGVSRPAAVGIMGTLYPIVASVLGREVASRNLDAVGLAEMLRAQKQKLFTRPGLPSTFAGMLGLRETADVTTPDATKPDIVTMEGRPVPVSGRTPIHRAKSRSWLPLALVVGLLGVGAVLLARRSTPPRPAPVEVPRVEAPAAPERTGQTTLTSAEVSELNTHFAGKGVPDRLALSNVAFDGKTANLTSGEETIDRVATLMKEHPGTRVRVEGHTDEAGSPHANTTLSVQRAASVRRMLVDRGVGGTRIEIVGKGDQALEGARQRVDMVIIAR